MYILLGCVIALPILVIVLNLLSSADPVFAKVIKDIFGKLFFSWDIVKIVLFAAVIFLFLYGFIVKAGRRDLGANAPKEGQYECSDRYNYNDSAHSFLSDICRCSDSVSVHEQCRTSGRYDIRRVCKTGLLPAALCSGCKCVYGADI